jgi:alpha-mannosidase
VLENSRFRLTFGASGALLGAYDRRAGQELLGPAGAEFVIEEDLGCFCHIDPTGAVWRQSDNPLARIEVVEAGPVRWRIAIENESKGAAYRQWVSIYEHLPWIEFETTMDIRSGEDLRARAAFDLPAAPAEIWAETAFGAIRRDPELAHAVNWVDCGWPHEGLALLNRGLTSYEVADHRLYLTLWRGLSLFNECYGCLQREQRSPLIEQGRREFRYALLPHAGDWRQAGLVRWGQAFNTELQAIVAEAHPGRLPARQSWLAARPDNVVISTVKGAEFGGDLIVRLYEASGAATLASLRVPDGFGAVCETNLLEDERPWAPLNGGEVEFALRPFEIKTLMLRR